MRLGAEARRREDAEKRAGEVLFTPRGTCPGIPSNRNAAPARPPCASRSLGLKHRFRTPDLSSTPRPPPRWAGKAAQLADPGGSRRAWFGTDHGRTIAAERRSAGGGAVSYTH